MELAVNDQQCFAVKIEFTEGHTLSAMFTHDVGKPRII